MARVLIIGKMPPPIGGVTTHVARLVAGLRERCFDFSFCDLHKDSIAHIASQIARHRILHIHFSSPWAQLLFGIFCRITGKKLIITYHGQWGRYNWLENRLVELSAALAHVPVIQEHSGFKRALRCNFRARLISTYITGGPIEPLPNSLKSMLEARCRQYQATFSTNAWNVTFDRHGRETYGISALIARFKHYPQYQLLISDPSGKYQQYINRNVRIPVNVLFISTLHDFRSILLLSDAFIRNSTTDGVSLSIHEAWELQIPVLASAAVERPAFCCVFDDFQTVDLNARLEEAKRRIRLVKMLPDTVTELIDLYRELAG